MTTGERVGVGHDPARGTAYVEGWIQPLEEDPREIRGAAGDAQRISDFVLARHIERETTREAEPIAASPRATAPGARAELSGRAADGRLRDREMFDRTVDTDPHHGPRRRAPQGHPGGRGVTRVSGRKPVRTTFWLVEAARESGYSADHLGRLVRDGKIPNAGRPGAPRIARRDLPRKAHAPPEARLAETPRPRDVSRVQIVQSIIEKGVE